MCMCVCVSVCLCMFSYQPCPHILASQSQKARCAYSVRMCLCVCVCVCVISYRFVKCAYGVTTPPSHTQTQSTSQSHPCMAVCWARWRTGRRAASLLCATGAGSCTQSTLRSQHTREGAYVRIGLASRLVCAISMAELTSTRGCLHTRAVLY